MRQNHLSLNTCYLLILFNPLLLPVTISAQSTKIKPSKLLQLCTASQCGNLRKVKKCLRKNPTLINQLCTDPTSTFSGTALHYAVGPKSHPKLDVLAYLFMNGCDPTTANHTGDTPLHYALRFGKDPAIIAALINAGSPLTSQDDSGATPLHCALFSGNSDNIQLLLANRAPLDILNKKNFPAAFQIPNPKYFPRNGTAALFIAQIVRCARIFHDTEDKVSYIEQPVNKEISPQAQLLGFKTLVETCELKSLMTLHEALICNNQKPDFLEALLVQSGVLKLHKQKKPQQDVPKKNFLKKIPEKAPEKTPEEKREDETKKKNLRLYEKPSSFCALLCKHWLKMPQKIVSHVETGKLDAVLENLKTVMPSTKMHTKLLMCICKRLNGIILSRELKSQKNADLLFGFV